MFHDKIIPLREHLAQGHVYCLGMNKKYEDINPRLTPIIGNGKTYLYAISMNKCCEL